MVATRDRARLLLCGQLSRADCKSVTSLGSSLVQSVRVSVRRSASQAAAKAALESDPAPTKQHAAAKMDQPEPRSMDNLHEAESSTSGRRRGVEGTWSTLFAQMMERSKTRPRSNTTTEAFKIPKPYPDMPALGLDGVGYQFFCEQQQQRLNAYREGLSRDPKKMVTLPIMSKSELEMRQLNMEAFSVDWALEKRRKGMEAIKNTTSSLPRTGRAMIQDWYTQLTAAVLEEQNKVLVNGSELGTDPNLLKVEKTLAAYRRFHAPYLHLLSPEALAGITINCVVRRLLQDGGSIRVGRTAASVGNALMHEVNFLKARDQTQQVARLQKEIGLMQRALAADGETPEAVDSQAPLCGRTKELQNRLLLLEEQLKKVLAFGRKLTRIQTLWAAAPDRINSLTRIALADQAEDWGQDTILKVGTVMLQLLLCTAKIPPDSCREAAQAAAAGAAAGVAEGLQPALDRLALQHTLVTTQTGPKLAQRGYLNCNPKALAMLHQEEEELRELVQPVYQPMVLPPVPWTRHDRGGHLSLRTCVVRSSFPAQLQLLREADAQMEAAGGRGSGEGMDQVYTALDVLGRQSWGPYQDWRPRTSSAVYTWSMPSPEPLPPAASIWESGNAGYQSINKEVLHAVEELRERTEGTWVDLPRKHDLPLPLPPKLRFRWVGRWESGEQAAVLRVSEPTKREMRAWERSCRMIEQGNREQYSLRCDLQYKLDVGRRFLNDRIYFPHNCDFRGRAYPLHPHLHHLGNDACRGLLRFGTGRPLGPQGLRWLKLHIANVYGHGWDKLSLSGRVDTVQQNLEVVLDSAQRPLNGFRWWMGAESPFQCLAACLELRDALASPDPERFVSFLPVHQDGSCNGMQHYAALGRDLEGGRAVSLIDAEQPSDVYSTVARRVQAQVEQDASQGVPEAVALLGQVDRKLVKQTVMTTVYGVTFVGARRQIEDRLRERGWQHERMHQVTSYAAKVTMRGLKDSFRNADKIMDWLARSARAIAKDGQFVKWTSPIGLPIVQPYHRKKAKSVKTVLQHLQVWDLEGALQVHKMSQKTAFPPNYIHSIDSSHMMMTALACEAAGIAFAGVHDSYWTHAGSVEKMNSILRDTFVDLHSQPLLQNLKEEFTREYKGVHFPDLPETGSLNLESIREARYFFS